MDVHATEYALDTVICQAKVNRNLQLCTGSERYRVPQENTENWESPACEPGKLSIGKCGFNHVKLSGVLQKAVGHCSALRGNNE